MPNRIAEFGKTVSKATRELFIGGDSFRGSNPLPQNANIPQDILLFGGDGVNAFYRFDGTSHSAMLAYEQCPPLQAICNRRGLALTNGILNIKNSVGKPSNSIQSKKLLTLLGNPNPLQTRSHFIAQAQLYIDLIGYCVVVPLNPVGYSQAMQDAQQLWIVPMTMVSLESNYTSTLNFITGGIDYVNIGGTHVDPSKVMILTDINAAVNKMIIPTSKIRVCQDPINNIIGSLQSESNLIKQRGPSGILSNRINPQLGAPLPLPKDEKENIQNSFNRSFGFLNGQSSIIITTAAMEWQKTGFNYTELGLDVISTRNTKILADSFGYPTPLLGVLDSKYDNMEQADKALYTKFIIPAANNLAEQIGSYMLSINDTLYFDFKHIPELQQDTVKQATARSLLGKELRAEFFTNMITYNRMMELLNEEPTSFGDEYYYKLKTKIDFDLPSGAGYAVVDTNPSNDGTNNQSTTATAAA